MIDCITTYEPYKQDNYWLMPCGMVTDSNGIVKQCIPITTTANLRLINHGRIVHWSQIDNCLTAFPNFYLVYPYRREQCNEVIIADDVISSNYKGILELGDVVLLRDGVFCYLDIGLVQVCNKISIDKLSYYLTQ
jgi:hypothetical protein